MFRDFLNYFNESEEIKNSGNLYNDFILQLGGKRFGNGVFNSFSNDNLSKWSEIVSGAYPEFKNLFKLFGYDSLGRCFGIDLRERTYGDVLEIPQWGNSFVFRCMFGCAIFLMSGLNILMKLLSMADVQV